MKRNNSERMHPTLKALLLISLTTLTFAVTKFDDDHLNHWTQTVKTNAYPKLRKNAAFMLGKLNDPRAVPALVEVIAQDTDAVVRGASATALGKLGSSDAIEPLTYMMNNDADKTSRNLARQAIDRIYLKMNLKKEKKEKLGKLFGTKF